MSNRPCILHTRRYRAVYEGLVNVLRESDALQPHQLARLKEMQSNLCSCVEQELPIPDGDASSSLPVAVLPAGEHLASPEHQPGWRSALQGAQSQLLHLAQRQSVEMEAVMAPAAQRLGDVVARAVETMSEKQLVRKQQARREARYAEDWLYSMATPVVKRRGGARRGGPFGRPVAGRLTSTCLGRASPDACARGAALALAVPAYHHACRPPTHSVSAAPAYGSAAVLDLSELLEAKLQLRRGKHRQQQSAWRKRQGGRAAAADIAGDVNVATCGAAAAAGGTAAAATASAGHQALGHGHLAGGFEPMDVADGMCAMSLVGCGATAVAAAAGAAGVLGRAGSVHMACACEAE